MMDWRNDKQLKSNIVSTFSKLQSLFPPVVWTLKRRLILFIGIACDIDE